MLVYLSVCMINLIFLLVGYFIGSRTLENKTREAFDSLKNKFSKEEEYEAVEID